MNNLSLDQLDKGIDALIENASALIEEASLLLQAEHYARAYCLAHLAREETAKITMLFATGVRILIDHPVDWKNLKHRFSDHRSKLSQDTLFSYINSGLVQQKPPSELLDSLPGVVNKKNADKNASLYVGFLNGEFVKPNQRISKPQAERTVKLARFGLEEWKKQRSITPSLSSRSTQKMKRQFSSWTDPKGKSKEELAELLKLVGKLTAMLNEYQDK